MRLDTEFVQLPFTFDADRLAEEVSVFAPTDWQRHPTGFKGNAAIRLISARGEENDDMSGPMLPTVHLQRCPYVRQVMGTFKSVFGRSRFMLLGAGNVVPAHSDINYHWYSRVRIHVPVTTEPAVRFHCGTRDVHMGRGEAWIFDNWRSHMVTNPTSRARIHLVIDTSGSADFWDMLNNGRRPFGSGGGRAFMPVHVPYRADEETIIRTEQYNAPDVMAPGELEALASDILEDLQASREARSEAAVQRFAYLVKQFCREWRMTWALYGRTASGWPHYRNLLNALQTDVSLLDSPLTLASNGARAGFVLFGRVIEAALTADRNSGTAPNLPSRDAAANTDFPIDEQGKTDEAVANVRQTPRVSRNAPCTCGSGKKYKHCHGII